MKDTTKQMYCNGYEHKPLGRSGSGGSGPSSLASLCTDISPSSSHFFEVLYIGKVRISNRRISDGFIDAALMKFRQNELQRNLFNNSYHSLRRPSQDVEIKLTEVCNNDQGSENTFLRPRVTRARSNSIATIPQTKKEQIDQNRTMLFHVGRADLRLVSPDQKQILLYKQLRDVVSCIQSKEEPEHFGVICRDPSNANTHLSYVFKCESDSVVSEIIAAVKQSHAYDSKRANREAVMSCEQCPMIWFQRLLLEIEGLKDQQTMQNTILKRIEELPEDEQELVLNKLNATASVNIMDDNCAEQNQLLLTLLKAHCEGKQSRHVHDTAENRHEFLNHYLGGGTIFMKAKRSLTSSFDQLLKRRVSKDSLGLYKEFSLPIKGTATKESSLQSSTSSLVDNLDESKQKNLSSPSLPVICANDAEDGAPFSETTHKRPKSPKTMRDIFLIVGSSARSALPSENELDDNELETGSWRHNIFKNVITPKKNVRDAANQPKVPRSRMELRELWKKAINQQILLIRMEKENAKLYARQEEATTKRIKLEYDDISSSAKENTEVWETIMNKGDRKYDDQMLLHAIKKGIPRSKRGEAWIFLAEQYCARMPPPIDTLKFPKYNLPYDQLLKELTSQQHAILIDLGRTFPNHSYFMSPLGPGQLALFNLLKAYSLLDEEVGYCQGLSFIAGVLLLHMSESEAFIMLRHLMFRRNLRQQYLPDMAGLQIQLYQLTRLVKDFLPELLELFDKYEISPILYAAPWILTIFASQFPLGFVVRIFDLIFVEGSGVIFKAILSLLTYHKDNLLACDGFEQIMDYLKITMPQLEEPILEYVVKSVCTMDITKQLIEYSVEYTVLQEELSTPRPETKKLKQMEEVNKMMKEKNQSLMEQLEIALSNNSRLETVRVKHLSQINKLESEVRTLEVTVATLGNFISTLAYGQTDIEIPNDVLRILSQLNLAERRRSLPKVSLTNLAANTELSKDQNITLGQIKHTGSLSPKVAPSFFAKSFNQIRQQKLGSMLPNDSNINKHLEPQDASKTLTKSLSDTRNIKFDRILEESVDRSQSLGRVLSSHQMETLKLFQKNYSKELHQPESKNKDTPKRPILKVSKSNFELTAPLEVASPNDENSPYPLNCGGVQISYSGPTKLKSLRPTRTKSELQMRIPTTIPDLNCDHAIDENENHNGSTNNNISAFDENVVSVDSNGNISGKSESTVNAVHDSKLNTLS